MKLNKYGLFVVVLLTATLLPVVASAGDMVPYKATLASTHLNVIPPGMGDTGRCANIPAPLGMGWGLITITAVGNSTLMGLVIDVQSHCSLFPLDPNAPAPPVGMVVPATLGQAVLIGANGDSIRGTYEATLTFTDAGAVINGVLITDGGTGRFAGAHGEGAAFGVQSQSGAALTLTGTMTSVGTLKKK